MTSKVVQRKTQMDLRTEDAREMFYARLFMMVALSIIAVIVIVIVGSMLAHRL